MNQDTNKTNGAQGGPTVGQTVTNNSNGQNSGGAGSPTAASTANGNGTSANGGVAATPTPNGGSGQERTATSNAGQNGQTTATTANGQTTGTNQQNKDRNRDLSTAKTAGSTPQNANPNANRTIGHYVVGRSLGQGTFGKVRLGTHLITGEKVAIKILEKDKIKDQSDVDRVTREIHILKIVRHPNVIQLYEIIETSRQLFLIMEYASGGELFDYIVKRKRLQEEEACRFIQQIVSGVEYIHKVKICHRDLKPENLLLDDQNNIKIVDFGLSNMYGDGETLKTACGSPCYAAPEMIAGKRYHGLNSDIWSTGIILYAMTCGYLPFEDPNTSKLYKKILSCDYLIPGVISKACRDLIKKILNTDPQKRFTVKEIRGHEWYGQAKASEMDGIVVGKDRIPVLEEYLSKIQDCFATSGVSPNCDLNQTVTYIQNNKHNQITSTYYLLLKKKQRETGRDYFFEQVMRDKKRNLYSTSNLNNITLNSLQKIQTPGKIIMHSTMGSGFKVNQVSKSEARPLQTQENFTSQLNPAAKKYLDQINNNMTGGKGGNKKRTESTAQARIADMMSNFKANAMDKHAMTNNPLAADTLVHQNGANFRGAQSQSPTQRMNGMLGGKPNQTFFMADRMRKQGGQGGSTHHGGQRPLSIDEMNSTQAGIMLQSTNDSRIHEMLPNVTGAGGSGSQNGKHTFNQTRAGGFGLNSQTSGKQQQQMRQTMFNGNFMTKLRQSNAGHYNNSNMGSQQQYEGVAPASAERDSSAFGSAAGGAGNAGVGNSRIGTTSGVGGGQSAANQAHLFNLVNQRKTPNANGNGHHQMMMTTQFFNQQSGPGVFPGGAGQGSGAGHSTNSSISKTIAQAKLRKQRATRGASNPVNHVPGHPAAHHQHHASDSFNGSTAAEYQNAINQGGSSQFNSTVYQHGGGQMGHSGGVGHVRKQSFVGYAGNNLTSLNAQLNIGNFTQGPNGSTGQGNGGNLTAISGGRKPTADSHAYTLYKPNKQNQRGKFSNGGGSVSGVPDGSFDGYGAMPAGAQNNSFMSMGRDDGKQRDMSNFSTNPNTTGTRFFNPAKHSSGGSPAQHHPNNNLMGDTHSSRFMQNLQNNRSKMVSGGNGPAGNGPGVFQNNFLLPKASPNAAGMMKTFYNSKQSTSGPTGGNGASTTGSSSGGMPGSHLYSQQQANHNQNNSSNSTRRALQGMNMHI